MQICFRTPASCFNAKQLTNDEKMTSLIYYLKKNAYRTPRFLGNAVAHVPYSLRLGFGSDYRNARATRCWLEEEATLEEERSYIFENVSRIVRHASANVPFYAQFYAENGFNPNSLRSFEDLTKIPIVTKSLLQTTELEHRSFRRQGRTPTYTGGSTGEPFKFYSDSRQIGVEWAHIHHIWESLGYRQSDLLLSVALDETRPPIYYDALRHSLVLNIHYSFDTLIQTFMKIPRRARRIRFFRGYPSSFAEFLSYCEEKAPLALSELLETLKGSFLASEFPTPSFRKTIEQATCRPTISWYGHSERAILAWEKTRSWLYEPMHSYGYCEAVRLPDGFVTLVGTSYWNFASPFIRYQVDDGILPIDENDGILRSFEIQDGRRTDFIIDKNGARFSITHLNLSCQESTWALARCVQVEQKKPGTAIFWVTPRRTVTVEELKSAFNFDRLNLECEFRIVEKPFVSARGKVLLKVSTE